MTGSILGERVLRKEDPKFLTTGGIYVDDMDEPLLEGAAARHLRPLDDGARPHHRRSTPATAKAIARRRRRLHRRRPRPGAGPLTVQPDGRPPAAGHRRSSATSASPSPPSSRETPRTRARTPPSRSIVDYEPLEVLLDVEASVASSTLLYPNAGSNVRVRLDRARHARHDRRRVLRRLRGRRQAAAVNQRVAPCPLEVRGVGRGVGRRPARTSGCRPSTPRAPGTPSITRPTALEPDRGAHHHPRRRRRLRRQDRRVPGGAAARPPRQGARPAGALARDPQRVACSASATAGPSCRTSPSAAPATARSSPTACRCLQDCGAFAEIGTVLAAVHDPADVVGRVRHPEHRVPHHVGRHQHHADRRLPRRRAAGGHRGRRAGDGPVRRRDRHGPGRRSAPAT